MATVDEIMDAVRAYGVLSMRLGVDYLSETLVEQHEQFNRIRAMLAPVAPDPALREAIAEKLYDFDFALGDVADDWPIEWARLGEQPRTDYRNRASAVLAVLAERGIG